MYSVIETRFDKASVQSMYIRRCKREQGMDVQCGVFGKQCLWLVSTAESASVNGFEVPVLIFLIKVPSVPCIDGGMGSCDS